MKTKIVLMVSLLVSGALVAALPLNSKSPSLNLAGKNPLVRIVQVSTSAHMNASVRRAFPLTELGVVIAIPAAVWLPALSPAKVSPFPVRFGIRRLLISR